MVRYTAMCDGEERPTERYTPVVVERNTHPHPSRVTWLASATESFWASVALAQPPSSLRKWDTHAPLWGREEVVVLFRPQQSHVWVYLPASLREVVTKVRVDIGT